MAGHDPCDGRGPARDGVDQPHARGPRGVDAESRPGRRAVRVGATTRARLPSPSTAGSSTRCSGCARTPACATSACSTSTARRSPRPASRSASCAWITGASIRDHRRWRTSARAFGSRRRRRRPGGPRVANTADAVASWPSSSNRWWPSRWPPSPRARSLLSALVAAALLAAAFVFWRLSVLQEADRAPARASAAAGRARRDVGGARARDPQSPGLAQGPRAAPRRAAARRQRAERRKAERVVHEAERLEALTTDLLDFVRRGPIDVQPIRPAGAAFPGAWTRSAPMRSRSISARRRPAGRSTPRACGRR